MEYGSYPNNSSIVRIQMANEIDLGQGNPELLPFGSQGPVKRQDFRIEFDSGSATGQHGTGSFLSQTSSWGDANVDLQYLNVRRKSTDSFKWFDQTGAAPDDAVVWGGGKVIAVGSTAAFSTSNAPDEGNQITLRAVDGTSVTFTVLGSSDSNTATGFSRGGSQNGLDNLKASLALSALSGKISAGTVVDAGGGVFTLTLTQATVGTVGDTAITSNLAYYNINSAGVATDTTFTGVPTLMVQKVKHSG